MEQGATKEQLLQLAKPLQMKWRVQRAVPNKDNPTHVIMVSYVDSRDVQDRLDEIVGPANWQAEYFECKGKQFCRIGIFTNGNWVWKGDSGSPSQTEKDKGETSDAFKRAAVHWGINRVGYQLGEVKLPCKLYGNKPYPCDDSGTFLKGEKLFAHCSRVAKVDDLEVEFEQSFEKASIEKNKDALSEVAIQLLSITDLEKLSEYYNSLTVKTTAIQKLFTARKEEINKMKK